MEGCYCHSVYELHLDALELLLDESILKNVEQAKEAWCPNAETGGTIARSKDGRLRLPIFGHSFCLDVANYPEDALRSKEDRDEVARWLPQRLRHGRNSFEARC